MKNKSFFYLQYDKINWEQQEKTKINSFVNNYVIQNIILKKKGSTIRIFDIGFGIGYFFKMLYPALAGKYNEITLAGCEPSEKNFDYFVTKKPLKVSGKVKLELYEDTFQNIELNKKFDFVTAIYVFPHFSSEDLEEIAEKIKLMLNDNGKFILVVANEDYLKRKLKDKKDLFIEQNIIELNGKEYKEVLHYSDIPKIGKVIDYNREEAYYLDLFENNGLKLITKKDLNDNGFICTVFVFEKE